MSTIVKQIKERITIKKVARVATNVTVATYGTRMVTGMVPLPDIATQYPVVMLSIGYIIADFFTEEYFR